MSREIANIGEVFTVASFNAKTSLRTNPPIVPKEIPHSSRPELPSNCRISYLDMVVISIGPKPIPTSTATELS